VRRVTLSVRVRPQLRDWLVAAAAENRRSVGSMLEMLLEEAAKDGDPFQVVVEGLSEKGRVLGTAVVGRDGVGDRGLGTGGLSLGAESTTGRVDAAADLSRPATAVKRFDRDCAWAESHVEGRVCKRCGGSR